ncbi:MAG TPA: peroxiredoxin-like family protein [Solirubrobacteraceae bacterium]|nr:peroxiredoxin-like family protein [Solirubrobacteraceae bacterium]
MQLHRARSDFDHAGANLVLIGQATPRHAAHFRRRQGIQLPVLADEERVSYEAAGAKPGGVGDLWHPKVVAKGAMTAVREKTMQTRTIGDANQLGGVLVIDTRGNVTWSHMSTDASDNASPEDILAAVRAAVS